MNVKFIDTSVMLNLLEVPKCCSSLDTVKRDFNKSLEDKDVLILPIATIIETGNHISHIADGHVRRTIAGKFAEFLRRTANNEAPWQLYSVKNIKDELLYFADNFQEKATCEIGIGDISIIYAYERYIEEMPAIGTIMIWSTDGHLQGYRKENVSMGRRRKKK